MTNKTDTVRVALNNGGWFNLSKAFEFKEDTWFNGSNHISSATGSQWHHEMLYFTRSGNWVLHRFSQYQNECDSYERIDESDAVDWLIAQDCLADSAYAELPESVRTSVDRILENTEI